MLLLSITSTGHLLCDWLGGIHVLMRVAMNQNNKYTNYLHLAGWKGNRFTNVSM